VAGLERGDLILLEGDQTGATVTTSGWASGAVKRSGERGEFPAENLYVLPCVNEPPDDILVGGLAFAFSLPPVSFRVVVGNAPLCRKEVNI